MSKLMRRIWSILIAVAMCVTILPLNAFALDESTGTMVATFDQVSALVGETAQVKLTLKNNPGITSFKLAVKWDADFLTLEGIDYNSALGGMSIPPASSTSPAYIQWVSGTSNVDLNGVFATLKFKVSEDAPANALATITADFDPDDICKLVKNGDTYDEENVPTTIVSGSVRAMVGIPGDINMDSKVNNKDLVRLAQYLASWQVEVNEVALDVNGDGKVNNKDLVRLAQYLANWNVEIFCGQVSNQKCNHNLESIAGKAAGCEEAGNIPYWHCTKCGKYYDSADATKEITLAETVIPSLGGHTPVVDPAVPATSTSTGLTEGSHCGVCGKVLVAQQVTPILQSKEYTITYNIAGNDSYLQQQKIQMPEANQSTFTADEEVVFEDLVCPGYTFLGWYDAYGNPMPKVSAGTKRNVTVYAKWQVQTYPVVFKYDNELAGLIDTSSLENVQYTVNKTKALPVLSLPGYTFIGWSDESGNLCSQIKPGSTGEKIFYANWLSDRNKAWKAKDIGNPYIYEDDDMILFTYEIGKVENVPVYEIEDFGKIIAGGVAETRTKKVSAQMTEGLINAYSSAVEKATTGNATWTLSDGWTDSMSVSEEWAQEHGTTAEKVKEESTTETGNWFVNKSSGGSQTSTTIDTTDTYNLATTTNNTKTYGSKDETAYDNHTKEGAWNINGSLELGAKESIKTSASVHAKAAAGGAEVGGEAGVENSAEFEQKLTVSGGYEQKTTDKTGKDTVTKSGSDTDSGGGTQTGTVSNHTSNSSSTSNWNNESGFGGSNSTSSSTKVAQAVSELISNKTGYGKSYIKTGSSTNTQGLSTTNSNKDTFSSQVTYSKVTGTEETVTYSTAATVTGYHRWVMATTAHVFGVVGYDKEKESYFTTTYSIMDDKLQKYQDYSYKTSSYNDNQSGIIDFTIPDAVTEYVKGRTFATEGLEFNLDGYVTAYHGTDSAVIIPDYKVIDNLDGTKKLVKVVGIKDDVFKGNTNITGVALSSFMTEIPDGEFEGCSELWDVFGVNIKKIGANAFAGCNKLRSFTLSKDITELGNSAFSSTDFLEVTADNNSMVKAALNSGAKNIVINLNEMTDTLDGETLEVPEGTKSFVLRGYGKEYNNLTIISHAEDTKLVRLTINSDFGTPLQLDSKDIVLNQVTVNAKGICTVMNSAATNLGLYGTVNLNSEGMYGTFCKYPSIYKIDGDLYTILNVNGNLVTCGDIGNNGYLNITNGEIIKVSESDFDKMLHSFTLHFDANGGTCDTESKEVPNGTAVGTLPTPEREYYDFDGWYTEREGGNRVDEATALTSGGDMTLYAHWTRQTYTITFDANGGTVDPTTKIASRGEAVGELPIPSREYYTFDGWYSAADGGNLLNSDSIPTEQIDQTVYAHWTQNGVSDWVAPSDVPEGAEVTGRKWTYTQRNYTESGNADEPGWTRYDAQRTGWGATQGPVYYDPSDGTKNVWSEQYVASSNYRDVYVYYRWTSGDADTGSTYSYDTGHTQWYRVDAPLKLHSSNWYGHAIYEYWYTSSNYRFVMYSGTEQAWVSDNYATRWYYQDPVYTYYYYQDNNLESDAYPNGDNISNIVEWVQYRAK